MKKIRWVCPECGKGRNLGPRPRKNATDRFCIPCSVESGTIVERYAPARVRQQEAARTKAKNRVAKKRASVKRKWVIETSDGPVDTMAVFKAYWKAACRLHPPLAERFKFAKPKFTLHKRGSCCSTGRAYYQEGRVHVSAGTNRADLLYTIAHEIAHHMRYANGDLYKNGRYQHHDDEFKSLERMLLAEIGVGRGARESKEKES